MSEYRCENCERIMLRQGENQKWDRLGQAYARSAWLLSFFDGGVDYGDNGDGHWLCSRQCVQAWLSKTAPPQGNRG